MNTSTAAARFNPSQDQAGETATLKIGLEGSRLPGAGPSTATIGSGEFVFPSEFQGTRRSMLDTALPQKESKAHTENPFPDQAPALSFVPQIPSPPRPLEKLLVLQKWEGTVISSSADEFTAELRDLTSPDRAIEQVVLSVEEIAESDRRLMASGAVFYWSVGYRETLWGQRERVSSLRFRRLPAWTRSDLDEVKRKAREFAALIRDDATERRRD